MINTRILPAVVLGAALALSGTANAAGGEGHVEDVAFSFEGPFGTYDSHQLQRGLQVYHKVCAACHGLRYLAFRDLGRSDGPALPEDQIKALAAEYTCTDRDTGEDRACLPSDLFPANTGAGAPDLTLMAKARAGFHGPMGLGINQFLFGTGGPEYIFSILTGYSGKEEEVAGSTLYENAAMPGGKISMAPPLYDGVAEDMDIQYAVFNHDGTVAEGEAADDHGDGHAYHPPEPTEEQMAEDVAAFLMFAAEPTMVERKSAGFRNLLMVILLAVLLYYTNKALWKPIKRKD